VAVVRRQVRVGRVRVVRLVVDDRCLGKSGLDAGLLGRVGDADREPERRDRARREAELGGHLARLVAQGADEGAAEAEGLRRDDGVLGGEGGVDEADQRRLQVARRLDRHAVAGRDSPCPGQVGDPHQQDGRLADERLATSQSREPRLALGVADHDHAPGLEVRGGRGGLGRCHQRTDLLVGDVFWAELPHRPVGELEREDVAADGEREVTPVPGCCGGACFNVY